jgi:Fe2+ transport system protein FeoA
MTLKECDTGKAYIVERLDTDDEKAFKKICSLGILPGIEIVVLQKKPCILFKVYNSQFSIDHQLAEKIYVEELGARN